MCTTFTYCNGFTYTRDKPIHLKQTYIITKTSERHTSSTTPPDPLKTLITLHPRPKSEFLQQTQNSLSILFKNRDLFFVKYLYPDTTQQIGLAFILEYCNNLIFNKTFNKIDILFNFFRIQCFFTWISWKIIF